MHLTTYVKHRYITNPALPLTCSCSTAHSLDSYGAKPSPTKQPAEPLYAEMNPVASADAEYMDPVASADAEYMEFRTVPPSSRDGMVINETYMTAAAPTRGGGAVANENYASLPGSSTL